MQTQERKSANAGRTSWATQIVRVFLTVLFLTAGGAKLIAEPMMMQMFDQWGFPAGFMYAVGVVEVAGGVMLLIPQVRRIGASLLLIVMLGALGTHLMHGEWARLLAPLAVILAILTVGNLIPDRRKLSSSRDEARDEGHAEPMRG